jgi:glycosyltransferase involved in cell wall biosynthesis
MKILHLISSKGFFGAENVIVQLCKVLHKYRDVKPIAGVIENKKTPHVEVAFACNEIGIETCIFSCNSKADFKTILQLRRYITKNKIDIVHSHGYKANIYSFMASLGTSARLVATCHNWINSTSKMDIYTLLDLLFLKKFDRIVAVSDQVQKTIQLSGIRINKIEKVDNGIECSNLYENTKAPMRNYFGIPNSAVVVGCVGRISKEKGHRHLLKITSEILSKHPEVYFLIIGDGDLRIELEKLYCLRFVSPV